MQSLLVDDFAGGVEVPLVEHVVVAGDEVVRQQVDLVIVDGRYQKCVSRREHVLGQLLLPLVDSLRYYLYSMGSTSLMHIQLGSHVAHVQVLFQLAAHTEQVHLLVLGLEVADLIVLVDERNDLPLATVQVAVVLKYELVLRQHTKPFADLKSALFLADETELPDLARVQRSWEVDDSHRVLLLLYGVPVEVDFVVVA